MSDSAKTYVYGVIPTANASSWPADIVGIEGAGSPVRTVVEGDLAALVSDLAPDHTPGRREDVETHRNVLEEAIDHGTTIPMRFGIVMDDDDAVRELLLSKHRDDLHGLLQDLDGRVQMTVKAFYADDALLQDALASDAELMEKSALIDQMPETDRIQIGELLAKAVDARRAQVEAALLDELSPLADKVQVDPPSGERGALNAQVLIHKDRRQELDDKVHRMSEGLRGLLGFRYVGPLPPYSFASMSLEEAGQEDGHEDGQ
jgi:Gas vesicle synthesis protein GvpL/GvpF